MEVTLATVITSAAVGALVSSLLTFVGQWLERRSRRDELLLEKALELATSRRDFVLDVAKSTGVEAEFIDEAEVAAEYYRALKHVMTKGKLPADFGQGHGKTKT